MGGQEIRHQASLPRHHSSYCTCPGNPQTHPLSLALPWHVTSQLTLQVPSPPRQGILRRNGSQKWNSNHRTLYSGHRTDTSSSPLTASRLHSPRQSNKLRAEGNEMRKTMAEISSSVFSAVQRSRGDASSSSLPCLCSRSPPDPLTTGPIVTPSTAGSPFGGRSGHCRMPRFHFAACNGPDQGFFTRASTSSTSSTSSTAHAA